jgi:hypothetical protein
MKKFLHLVIFILVFQSAFSQVAPTISQIEFSTYFFNNAIFQFEEDYSIEQFEDGEGYRFGILYSKKVHRKIWVSSGVNYLRATNEYFGPSLDTTIGNILYSVGARMIQVPAKVRFDIFKWFYLKSGISFDYQINNREGKYIHNQSGISYSLSCGIDLRVKEQIHLQIEPEVGFTSFPALYKKDYQQHYTLSGLNFILGFRL